MEAKKVDNVGMMDIDPQYPDHDSLGPKPPVDTPEALKAQIGTLTVDDLRKFGKWLNDEHFVQACLRGEHGSEIENSRLAALTRIVRSKQKVQYPDSVDENGKLKMFIGGGWGPTLEAETEVGRLVDAKLGFSSEEK